MNFDPKTSALRHPGEVVAEMLDATGMSKKELSLRSSVSEKYIDMVLRGNKEISYVFAKRLECALGLSAREWLDMQERYDEDRFARKERESVQTEELDAIVQLSPVLPCLRQMGFLREMADDTDAVLEVRNFLGVSDLTKVPEISYHVAYRAQHRGGVKVDPYILLAWQQMCERMTEDVGTPVSFDVQKLKAGLPAIRHLMFYTEEELPFLLKKTFSACGVVFRGVRRFEGAAMRGFIKQRGDGRLALCVAVGDERQDFFWRRLFRQIGHIINGKMRRLVDFPLQENEDEYADEMLLPAQQYNIFAALGNFSAEAVQRFAGSQTVPDYIVEERLLRDGLLPESEAVNLPRYTWTEI